MERPVGLEHQPMTQADEVQNVWAQRELPPEFEPIETSIPQ
jgi:hypothetical protein